MLHNPVGETVFFDYGGVLVTSSRFVTFGKTRPLAGITAISTTYTNPKRGGAILLLGIGIWLIRFQAEIVAGIGFLAAGILWLLLVKKTYHIRLESASGSSTALSSKDKQLIVQVAEALNRAIVHRG